MCSLLDIHNEKDVVHVALGHDGESSMEALLWALKHLVTPSTTVYLIHVFPETRLIPSPCKSCSSYISYPFLSFLLLYSYVLDGDVQNKSLFKIKSQSKIGYLLETRNVKEYKSFIGLSYKISTNFNCLMLLVQVKG